MLNEVKRRNLHANSSIYFKKSMKRHIPNALTSANLVCGCISIAMVSKGDMPLAAAFILLGAFFDFFDGFAARMLKVSSEIGAQLDSLADVVSFGVAPAFIAFHLMQDALNNPWLSYLAFVIAIFSAVRLARFNIDDRQVDHFIGLPTPANALFWVSIALSIWQAENLEYGNIAANWWLELSGSSLFLFAGVFVLSYLLIAELPLISLKFKQFGWKGNEYRYILLIISVIFILLFLFASIPFILLLYLILSIIQSKRTDEIHS